MGLKIIGYIIIGIVIIGSIIWTGWNVKGIIVKIKENKEKKKE